MNSTVIIFGFVALVLLFITLGGIRFGQSQSTDFGGWLVNNRAMGAVWVWFLLGTEIYTAFTFQGLAGFAYAKGGPAFYNVAVNDVAYALGFFVLPSIWLLGRKFRHFTQSDMIASRYQSKGLGILVAAATALIMIAYIDLNIEGLGGVVQVVTKGAVSPTISDVIGFIVLGFAVLLGGIRGNALQSAIKDIFMFIALIALFLVVPIHYFGGFGHMFHEFVTKTPTRVLLPGATKNLGMRWLLSTVLITGFGQWMWPHWFGVAYTAKGPNALKLQAVFMPLYQLIKVMVIITGFAAVIVLGTHQNGNNVVMLLAQHTFPLWFMAFFTAAAVLAAIVPAGPIIMTSCGLLARNVYQQLRPQTSDRTVFVLTKALVFPITLIALYFAVIAPSLIVTVLLVAYDFIAQLVPAVLIGGLFWRRATKEGVVAGLLTGWFISAYTLLNHMGTLWGYNSGFLALLANLVVFAGVSMVTKPVEQTFLAEYFGTIYPKGQTVPTDGVISVSLDQ